MTKKTTVGKTNDLKKEDKMIIPDLPKPTPTFDTNPKSVAEFVEAWNALTDEQREALAATPDSNLRTLNGVKSQLDAAFDGGVAMGAVVFVRNGDELLGLNVTRSEYLNLKENV